MHEIFPESRHKFPRKFPAREGSSTQYPLIGTFFRNLAFLAWFKKDSLKPRKDSEKRTSNFSKSAKKKHQISWKKNIRKHQFRAFSIISANFQHKNPKKGVWLYWEPFFCLENTFLPTIFSKELVEDLFTLCFDITPFPTVCPNRIGIGEYQILFVTAFPTSFLD